MPAAAPHHPDRPQQQRMTKGEREELRRLIRRTFKVRRAQVDEARARLLVDIDRGIGEMFADEDEGAAGAELAARAVVAEADEKVRAIFGQAVPDAKWKHDAPTVRLYVSDLDDSRRRALTNQARLRVDAAAKAAVVRLDTEEVAMEHELVADLFETAAAKDFLARIPEVDDILRAPELAELDAELGPDPVDPDDTPRSRRRWA